MLDREQVQKVATLARLALTDGEVEQFTHQIGDILKYFEQLSTLDTTDVEPTTRAIDVSNVTRPDELVACTEREAMLQSAPHPDGDFFRVPKILGDG